MQRRVRTVLPAGLGMTIIALAVGAAASHAAPTVEEDDPAALYAQAAEQLQNLSAEESDLLWLYDGAEPPSAELRAVLDRIGPALDASRSAAAMGPVDRGLDYDQGFDLMLPHLSEMRGLAKAMRVESFAYLHDGNTAAAREQVEAMYAMGESLNTDEILISGLVGQSIFALGNEGIDSMLDRGMLDAGGAAELAGALRTLDGDDPFGYGQAILRESDLAVASIQSLAAEHETEDGVIDFSSLIGKGGDLQIDDLDGEVARFTAAYDEAAAIFAIQDPDAATARMEAFTDQVRDGAFGDLTRLLMPSISKVLDSKQRAAEEIAARLEQLDGIADGSIDPMTLANGAVWYLKAARSMRDRSANDIETINRFLSSAGTLDESTIVALDSMQDVVATLAVASMVERCDFADLHEDWRHPLFPLYIDGMYLAERLLLADARRQFAAGDQIMLVARLDTLLRMSGHLSTQKELLLSLIANGAYAGAIDLAGLAYETQSLDEQWRDVLLAAERRVPHTDAFGYGGAMVAARENVRTAVARARMYKDKMSFEELDSAIAWLDGTDDRGLPWLLVLREASLPRLEGEGPLLIDDAARLERLDGLVDLAAIRAVLAVGPAPFEALVQDEAALAGEPANIGLDITLLRSEATQLLRRGRTMLRGRTPRGGAGRPMRPLLPLLREFP